MKDFHKIKRIVAAKKYAYSISDKSMSYEQFSKRLTQKAEIKTGVNNSNYEHSTIDDYIESTRKVLKYINS